MATTHIDKHYGDYQQIHPLGGEFLSRKVDEYDTKTLAELQAKGYKLPRNARRVLKRKKK